MKTRRNALRGTTRLLIAGTMTVALAACGGGSGDGGGSDIDGDGIPDSSDPDIDGDGIPNEEDADANENGIDDVEEGFIPFSADDIDADGIPNSEDEDIDGDGIANADDLDADGNGVDDAEEGFVPFTPDEGDSFAEVTEDTPCGSESGTDNASADNTWDNNCTVSRFNQWTDSLYSAGIQRVVYCSEADVADSSVDEFTDGEFGSGTETAVEGFQAANTLGADGVVGDQTWARLQAALVPVGTGAIPSATENVFDAFGVAGDRCAGQVLFYQEVSLGDDGFSTDRGGWTLARGANSTERVPFSIAEPFNRID